MEGVAFVQPTSAGLAVKNTHRVYLKNMLLSEQSENLLPDWAFFVKCVVNATDLRPTASRESFYEDDSLQAARDSLGQCLRRYFLDLARRDPARLNHLIAVHHVAMKALALDDDEFFDMFIDLLPFETSLGEMTLGEITAQQPVVRYVASRDQFRQVSGVASAQSMLVVNAGYIYDSDLLEKLSYTRPDQQVEEVDVAELSQSFEDLSLRERERVFEFVKLADLVLQPFKCSVEIKKFAPEPLPALYTANDSAAFLRSVDQSKDVADEFWSGVLDRVAGDPASDAYSQLCLNYRNPLIRKIAELQDRRLIRRSVEMLYVQALLLGHYPLKAQEMKLLNEGLLALIEYGVDARQGDAQSGEGA